MTVKILTALTLPALFLSACATSLSSLPPADIASKAVRAPDGFTGLTQTQLPAIAPFERSGSMNGQVRLLSAESFEGQTGGAWMDVALFYDTPGDDSDQMRVYKTLNWAGGEDAKLADFAASVASCEDRVTSHGYGGYGGYGRSGFGYSNYDYFGHRSGFFGHPRYRNHRTDRARSRSGKKSFSGALTSVINEVSRNSRPTSSPAPRSGPVTSRPAVTSRPSPRPTARPSPRPTARSATRARPRSFETRSRDTLRSPRRTRSNNETGRRFQNAQLAETAAPTRSASSARLRLSPISPYRRGYNYGHYSRLGLGYGPSDYIIKSACGRVEKLRVFVPKEKLAAAERYGLTLYARSESGDERTLTVPPNYVLAYQMATGANSDLKG